MPRGKTKGKGRGWHGDPEGHARAGRKGGRARGRKGGQSIRRSSYEEDLF